MTQKEGPSVEANMNYELTSDHEEELDRIVDTTGCSYYYAKRLMGLPVEDPKEVGNLIKRVSSPREVGDKAVKGFFCGDCCRNVNPGEKCPHVKIGSRGKRYANDDSRY
jgi:hypothetical protein